MSARHSSTEGMPELLCAGRASTPTNRYWVSRPSS